MQESPCRWIIVAAGGLLGCVAFVIAMTFKPFPRKPAVPAPA